MIKEYLDTLGRQAIDAKQLLQSLTTTQKNQALEQAAASLIDKQDRLLLPTRKIIRKQRKPVWQKGC